MITLNSPAPQSCRAPERSRTDTSAVAIFSLFVFQIKHIYNKHITFTSSPEPPLSYTELLADLTVKVKEKVTGASTQLLFARCSSKLQFGGRKKILVAFHHIFFYKKKDEGIDKERNKGTSDTCFAEMTSPGPVEHSTRRSAWC